MPLKFWNKYHQFLQKKPASFRINTVKMKTVFTFVFSMFIVIASVQGQLGKGKSVIKYLGTTFLMNDGCPAPKCDASRSECQRIRQMVRALYSHCLQSEVTTFFYVSNWHSQFFISDHIIMTGWFQKIYS